MPSSTGPEVRLARRGCVLALAGLTLAGATGLPLPAQAADTVQAELTDLSSNNERMISYRHQQHLVQTGDGSLHLMLNRGTLDPAPGLVLYSSFDGGSTWLHTHSFAQTDDKSTGDLRQHGDALWVAFHTFENKLAMQQLQYSAAGRSWTPVIDEIAYASGRYAALNPTLDLDDTGTVWVGFLSRTRFGNVGQIRVISRAAGGAGWSDDNLVFGPADDRAVERSARMARVPGGMGMVWTVRENTFWSQRADGDDAAAAWAGSPLHSGTPSSTLEDPYASHFNVTAVDDGTLHFITIDAYDIFHYRLGPGGSAWVGPVQVDDQRKVAYAQMGRLEGQLIVGYSVGRGRGAIVNGGADGATWASTDSLVQLAQAPGLNLNTARIELCARSQGVMAVLQQYSDNGIQRLMLYKVTAP